MTSESIVSRLLSPSHRWRRPAPPEMPPQLLGVPEPWPLCVQQDPMALRYLELLAPLDWAHFPERDLDTHWCLPTIPYVPYVAAYLVKLDQQLMYMPRLRQFLVEHPVLTAVLGFPMPRGVPLSAALVEATLPTHRHFARILQQLPNSALQWLLDDTVRLLCLECATLSPDFGQAISLDTKHILAWVKENNPKAYVTERYDKAQPPAGDPDCRLGCKRKRNQRVTGEPRTSSNEPDTPFSNPRSPKGVPIGEYYWGYASGIVATRIPGWAEIVLAELTQTFDAADVSYFEPLMADTERRLGFRPRFGAFDAAFDAFYIYEYFDHAGQSWETGFAAIPWAQRGPARRFDSTGLPLCDAELPMPLKHTFYVCYDAGTPSTGALCLSFALPGADDHSLPDTASPLEQGRLCNDVGNQQRSAFATPD